MKYKPSSSEHFKNDKNPSYFLNRIDYVGIHLEEGKEIIAQNHHGICLTATRQQCEKVGLWL